MEILVLCSLSEYIQASPLGNTVVWTQRRRLAWPFARLHS